MRFVPRSTVVVGALCVGPLIAQSAIWAGEVSLDEVAREIDRLDELRRMGEALEPQTCVTYDAHQSERKDAESRFDDLRTHVIRAVECIRGCDYDYGRLSNGWRQSGQGGFLVFGRHAHALRAGRVVGNRHEWVGFGDFTKAYTSVRNGIVTVRPPSVNQSRLQAVFQGGRGRCRLRGSKSARVFSSTMDQTGGASGMSPAVRYARALGVPVTGFESDLVHVADVVNTSGTRLSAAAPRTGGGLDLWPSARRVAAGRWRTRPVVDPVRVIEIQTTHVMPLLDVELTADRERVRRIAGSEFALDRELQQLAITREHERRLGIELAQLAERSGTGGRAAEAGRLCAAGRLLYCPGERRTGHR